MVKHSKIYAYKLERHIKGVANHWRIEILILVADQEGITLDQISELLDCDFKNTSQHTKRLVEAGLINKKHSGTNVEHFLSPYGKLFYKFIKSF